ncbi:MAG: LCP family protein [Bacilli bacterium]|nr:LCP family protein [Bacilli bacterium]
MKKIILKNILSIIVGITIILISKTIIDLNVLPSKYFYLFLITEGLFFIFSLLLYNLKKKCFVIIGFIFMLITIFGNLFLNYYFSKMNHYLDNNFAIESYKEKIHYYVVTSNNNPINGVEELEENTTIDYYKYSRAVDLALKKLGKFNYNSTQDGYDALRKAKEYSTYFVLTKTDFDFAISASNEFTENDFNIINEFDVLEEIKKNENTPSSYNVYINGLDYSGNRRDYNLIATVNTKTHKIVLTSIPRDFYIYVPEYDMKDSLTALGNVDPKVPREALESLFQTKIEFNIDLYTESLVKVVDTIGGVEFCTNKGFTTTHDLTLGSYDDYGEKLVVEAGCHTYNGLETLAIARERKHIQNGDRARQDNCRQLLINIGKKIASTINLTNYNDYLNSFDGIYTSNMNKTTITNFIKELMNNPNFEIIEQSVDGVDGLGIARQGMWGEVWTLEPKMYTVENASNVINSILNEE